MVGSTTLKATKADQCRLNAQTKSERKRQAVFDAIAALQQQEKLVTKAAIRKLAEVSYPFLSKHADLLQAIDEAGKTGQAGRLPSASEARGKDVVIAALQRQVTQLKQQVQAKDAQIRHKQREVDQLYGKLASRSELTDADLRTKLTEVLQRLQSYEGEK